MTVEHVDVAIGTAPPARVAPLVSRSVGDRGFVNLACIGGKPG